MTGTYQQPTTYLPSGALLLFPSVAKGNNEASSSAPRITVGELAKVERLLSRFVRNDGLSPGRLDMDGAELLAVLGTSDAQQVYDRILKVLDELDENQYSDVLRNAFGVGYSKKPKLSARREEWIARMEYPISENTIRRWEQRALPVLARRLVTSVLANPFAESSLYEEDNPASLKAEIDQLKRQLAEQNELLKEIVRRLPSSSHVDEEQDEFDVILEAVGGKKIKVITVLREIIRGLGLKEAKDLVEAAPVLLLEKTEKVIADAAKQKLEAAGASVSIK